MSDTEQRIERIRRDAATWRFTWDACRETPIAQTDIEYLLEQLSTVPEQIAAARTEERAKWEAYIPQLTKLAYKIEREICAAIAECDYPASVVEERTYGAFIAAQIRTRGEAV